MLDTKIEKARKNDARRRTSAAEALRQAELDESDKHELSPALVVKYKNKAKSTIRNLSSHEKIRLTESD